jgi:hypothetical protein
MSNPERQFVFHPLFCQLTKALFRKTGCFATFCFANWPRFRKSDVLAEVRSTSEAHVGLSQSGLPLRSRIERISATTCLFFAK